MIGPAGSINSNLTDMVRWVKLHLSDGAVGGTVVFELERAGVAAEGPGRDDEAGPEAVPNSGQPNAHESEEAPGRTTTEVSAAAPEVERAP